MCDHHPKRVPSSTLVLGRGSAQVSEMLRRAGAWSRHATRLCGSDISPATTGQSCRLYNMLQGCPHVSNLLNPEPATCSSCSSRDCGSDDPMSVSGGAAAASAPGSSAWDSVDLEGSPMAPERTLQAPRVLQPKKLRKNGSNDHPLSLKGAYVAVSSKLRIIKPNPNLEKLETEWAKCKNANFQNLRSRLEFTFCILCITSSTTICPFYPEAL